LAYEKTGSILVPVFMHSVFNAISVAGILFLL
jgi:membrane protease YdiL (CAAX protease family)